MDESWLLQVFCESNGCWCGNKTSTKQYLKLTLFPNEILTNQISNKNSTKQYLNRHLYPKSPSKEFFTKNNFKRNLHNHFFHENWQTSKLMTFTTFFSADCSSDFCHASCYDLFRFFGGDVSSFFLWRLFRYFFRRDSSSGIFFVEMYFFVCKMSLQSFLGIICERNYGREIV